LEAKKIAATAETFYVTVAPHNCDGPLKTMIGVQLCANIPSFLIRETFEDYDVPWRCDLTCVLSKSNMIQTESKFSIS
jgi:galactonate dehydratase